MQLWQQINNQDLALSSVQIERECRNALEEFLFIYFTHIMSL